MKDYAVVVPKYIKGKRIAVNRKSLERHYYTDACHISVEIKESYVIRISSGARMTAPTQ